ncbi:MAG: helix-turn-helix domain-containing protein [Candidatus Magasanikbacteria bacterium]|nr:helix-turn-helix domain-containing protein [Candidatus Magasanikbacteria bacterium]
MPAFEKKQLTTPTRVCLRLKSAREAKKVSLSDMAKRTHIDQKYLEAIEACQFDQIPFGLVYQKNFLKKYATVLNLPAQTFLDQFIEEETTRDTPKPISSLTQKKRLGNVPMLIRTLCFTAAIFLLIGYLGLEVKKSIDPPNLTLYSPPDGFITTGQSLTVRGETEHEVELSINGESIVPGNDGSFAEQVYLSSGVNTLIISAKRKHGKTTTITRNIILKEGKQFSYSK